MSKPPLSTVLPPVAPSDLPLTLMHLQEWQLVTLNGPDAAHYLQGQLTCDVNQLTGEKQTLCGHCDVKGKLWAVLRLFYQGDALAYLQRSSSRDKQVAELKKYAVFSKVAITPQPQQRLLGIAGSGARAALTHCFPLLPDEHQQVIYHQPSHSTLLYFAQPTERFLLITSLEQETTLRNQLQDLAELRDDQQWLALEIAAGLPVIDLVNSNQLIPQAVNLQALDAISFSKGCYLGQETVARAKYRGANKRALYWLTGHAEHIPAAGEELELQLGENWRRTGTVLAACQLADGNLWVQAVLNNDLAADSRLRVRDEENSLLTINALPYSL